MKKKFYLKKLNQAGFDHIFGLVVIVVLVGVVGTYVLIRAHAAGVYSKPIRSNYSLSRIDQGVDYGGNALVYPIGSGRIEGSPGSAAWPPGNHFIRYQLTNGPDSGKYVYVAEECSPLVSLRNGTSVSPKRALCHMYGGIEMGWAAPPQYGWISMATHLHQFHGGYTPEGANFNNLMVSLGMRRAH